MSTSGIGGGLFSSFHGSWTSPFYGEDRAALSKAISLPLRSSKPLRASPMMKNVNEGKGIFAPVVVLARNIIGKKRFNLLRGKAIALHSQASDGKQRQGLIRLAKKNGEKLGFLA
ncbi:hypothetical protein IEQ34_019867 [Dendrobium chrysotoxum]|uniref:PGR5 n=1 Tax=Dendrobium chrysotoxum TaxID=161865 RepID=A0AAV7GB32_DENCH|nr:hypothetical protein IEQ34_019867 [Dendrobium chrysotoxum]